MNTNQLVTKPLRNAGLLMGIGMGGFVDGILFHQVFQLHNMLSGRYYPDTVATTDLNMFWDGIFNAFTWTSTAFGIYLFWKASQRKDAVWSSHLLLGSLALGWGLFNLVEGIIDHHLLGLHHVVERAFGFDRLLWDIVFDLSGVFLILIGVFFMRRSTLSYRI